MATHLLGGEKAYTVGNLPPSSGTIVPKMGDRAFVTDCTSGSAVFGTAPVSGGSAYVPVFFGGAPPGAWVVG